MKAQGIDRGRRGFAVAMAAWIATGYAAAQDRKAHGDEPALRNPRTGSRAPQYDLAPDRAARSGAAGDPSREDGEHSRFRARRHRPGAAVGPGGAEC